MTTQEFYELRRKHLQAKLARLDQKEAAALDFERRHDEEIARGLAGVPGHFAHGMNFYKMFWVFFLCCIFGVALETVYCFITTGQLSQRTGLVWGPFNLVYGFGAVLLTGALKPFVAKSDRWIFFGGAVLGGAFEYFCSWFQEQIFGTVSWDYSEYMFNLNGRINLLYCGFWGILALFWVKEMFPRLNGFIERHVPRTRGIVVTWILALFMLANTLVSGFAVLRQSQRRAGIPASAAWQQVFDERFPDERLARIYPSMEAVEA